MDVERTIEFLLDQQAKFFGGMQELRENQAALQQQQAALQQQHAALQQQQAALQQQHGDLVSVVHRMAEQQLELTQIVHQFQQENRAAIVALANAQRHTDEGLNTLIKIVDDLIRRQPKQ